MRSSLSLAPAMCGVASAVFLVAAIFLAPDLVRAQDNGNAKPGPGSTGAGGSGCACPEQAPEGHKLWPKPRFAGTEPSAPARLDATDEISVLEAVHLALSEVGDGSTYVWHGRSGRVSGIVQPTTSFRDANGQICRHIVVGLSAEGYSRKVEGVACRLVNGSWRLEG